MGPVVNAVLFPFARLRTRLLRALGPLGRLLVIDREFRVAVQGGAVVLVALALTATVPLWTLAFGPIVLGVPHLLADLRYCIARPGYHRRPEWIVAVAAPLGALVLGAELWLGLLAVPGAFLIAKGSSIRRVLGVLVGAVLVYLAYQNGRLATLVLAHAHNFIAVALWWAWRPRGQRLHWIPLALFLGASLALAAGLCDGVLAAAATVGFLPGLGVTDHISVLARGVDPTLGLRLVLLYAFAQSVHYAMWLRMVPDEDRPRVAPRTFRRSWRKLEEDVGPVLLWGSVLGAVGLAVWAVFDLAQARGDYLYFARFHGVLELAAAGLFLMEGRPAGAACEGTGE